MASSTCVARTKHRLFKPGCLCFDDDSLQMALKSPKGSGGQVFLLHKHSSCSQREKNTNDSRWFELSSAQSKVHTYACLQKAGTEVHDEFTYSFYHTHKSAAVVHHLCGSHFYNTSQNAFAVTAFQPRPQCIIPLAQRAKYRWKLRETAASEEDPSAVHKCTYKQKITVRDVHHPCSHVTKAKS